MKKRFFLLYALLLIAIISLASCDMNTPTTIGGVQLRGNSDGTYTVIGYCGLSETINIPATYMFREITAIESTTNLLGYKNEFSDGEKIQVYVGLDSLTSEKKYNSHVREIIIPDTVKTISQYAFSPCPNLLSLTFCGECPELQDGFYIGCEKLVEVANCGDSPNENFQEKFGTDVKYVHSGESIIDRVGSYYFYDGEDVPVLVGCCDNETDLVLPKNYKGDGYVISSSAFSEYFYSFSFKYISPAYEFPKTSVVIPDGVMGIEDDAFMACRSLKRVEISASVRFIGKSFLYCDSIEEIVVSEDNEYYCSVNGNLYTKDMKTLLQYANAKSDSCFAVPDGVMAIEEGALESAINVMEVYIPASVKRIEAHALPAHECSLRFEDPEGWYIPVDIELGDGDENDRTYLSAEAVSNICSTSSPMYSLHGCIYKD